MAPGLKIKMSCKRVYNSGMPGFFKSRKKIYTREIDCSNENAISNVNKDVSNDAQKSLIYLHSIFPLEKFDQRIPPIIFKHQLYSITKNKTETDRQLHELKSRDEIRYFHLGMDTGDVCIVFTQDYEQHVKKLNENNPVVDMFLNVVCKQLPDTFLSREALQKLKIEDDEISQLFQAGVLTARDVGSWWISIPGAGEFMKCFLRGRKALLQMIRKSKYGEVLQTELETRKLPKTAKLGIVYHIHDVVGAELVYCVNTSSGRLLRERD